MPLLPSNLVTTLTVLVPSLGRAARNAGEELSFGAGFVLGAEAEQAQNAVANSFQTGRLIAYGLFAVAGVAAAIQVKKVLK